jgi:capsular exopolysaccharide synthesis family protein
MSERLTPLPSSPPTAVDRFAAPPAQQRWAAAPPTPPASAGNPLGALAGRSFAAIRRYKWLCLAVVGLGTAAGVAATSFFKPEYQVQGSVWLSGSESPLEGNNSGPIRASEIFRGAAWVELLRSFRIADSVVAKQALYVTPASERDSLTFRGFNLGPRLRPGNYELAVDAKRSWVLKDATTDRELERGAAGDSIGRRLGFHWAPPAGGLPAARTVAFNVTTPRDASIELMKRMQAGLGPDGAFLQLSLKGPHAERTAATLNTWMEEFIRVATDFRKAELGQFARDLSTQLDSAELSLREKERAYSNYRARTITEPGESPRLGGTADALVGANPVLDNYTQARIDLDVKERELAQLQQTIAAIRSGSQSADALLFIPSIANGPQGAQLRSALELLSSKKTQLRQLELQFTDQYKLVQDVQRDITTLEQTRIPTLANGFADQLRRSVGGLRGQIASRTRDIQAIPERTATEGRLRRDVDVASSLYLNLKNRFDQAQLAEASATPGVRIMDEAIAPTRPTTNTKPQIILGALLASIALGVLLALLLDRLDRRFRYPEQVTDDLGLDILGAVPLLKSARARDISPEEASQMVEAFRSVRLALRHTFASDGPVVLAVTSPGMGDGKSFVSSNLAMSFAEAGHRTLLIDGDIRRGEQHATFNVDQQPGLMEYLSGEVGLDEIVVPTEYDRLSLIPCGTRRRRGPELLASANMASLVDLLRSRYDAILIDSAPLGAGTDAYALGVAAGSVVLVFREGKTDRRMAQAKLSVLDRLPVHMLGAVLNCVPSSGGAYEFYSYLDGYAAEDDPKLPEGQRARLTSGGSGTR